MPYKYKTIEKINVLYCTSVTKQCFHVQREKCVCLTCGLPFGNKCIHLNQNGTFFTITVFCMPDVRNMLLEEQTKNLEWLILLKVRMCWLVLDTASLPAGYPLHWSGNLPALRVRDLCTKGLGVCFSLVWQSGVLCTHRKAYFSSGLCSEESAISSHLPELCIALIMRQTDSLQEL